MEEGGIRVEGSQTDHPQSASICAIDRASVHRICSGQVVLTLATAVKELLENSIDAQATIVEIKLKEYGSDCIEVSDNGLGVHHSNFQGLTLKHHTSKLQDFADLIGVDTFGFRGEALSSLCALCDMSITTRHKDAAVGTKLEYDQNGKIVKQTPLARQIGSTVTLQNLFYTLPVRHKEFQRNVKKEFVKMVQVLNSYCIISTTVRITCTNQLGKGNRSTVVSSKGNQSMQENISNVFGPKQIQSVMEFKQKTPGEETCSEFGIKSDTSSLFSIEGYVSKCEHGRGRSSTDRQFFFINGRPFDSNKLTKVINEVYHQYNRHQYPFVVLRIDVKKDSVDVNVTPDKRQVFMEGEKQLMAIVKASLIAMYEPTTAILQCQIPLSSKGGQDKNISTGIGEGFTRLSKHLSLEKPSGLSSLMKLKRSFSSAFARNSGDSTDDSLHCSPQLQIKQRKLDNFMSMEGDAFTSIRPDHNTEVNDIPAGILGKDDDIPAGISGKDDDEEVKSGKHEESLSYNFSEISSISRHADSPTENRIKTVMDVDEIEKEADVIVLDTDDEKFEYDNDRVMDKDKPYKTEHSLFTQHRTNMDERNKEIKLTGVAGFSSSSEDSGFVAISHSGDVFNKENSGFAIISHPTSKQINVDPVSEIESRKKVENSSDVLILSHGYHGDEAEKEEQSCDSGSPVQEQFDAKDDVDRVEKTITFSMESLCKQFRNKSEEKSCDKFSRAFRATINPADNQAAEQELQKEIKKDMFDKMEILGQFNMGFIITKLDKDLFIVDQHATDEKFNFETLQRDTVIQSQKMICPLNLELTASSETILMDNINIFTKNGFEFVIDETGQPTQRVKLISTPVSKNWNFGKEDIEEMIFMMTDSPGVMCRPSRVRAMFASRACRKSIMIGTVLNKPQMKKLVCHMGEIEQPWNCPHGRPTMRHLINLDMVPR